MAIILLDLFMKNNTISFIIANLGVSLWMSMIMGLEYTKYGNASILSSKRVVFNIKGNDHPIKQIFGNPIRIFS